MSFNMSKPGNGAEFRRTALALEDDESYEAPYDQHCYSVIPSPPPTFTSTPRTTYHTPISSDENNYDDGDQLMGSSRNDMPRTFQLYIQQNNNNSSNSNNATAITTTTTMTTTTTTITIAAPDTMRKHNNNNNNKRSNLQRNEGGKVLSTKRNVLVKTPKAYTFIMGGHGRTLRRDASKIYG